MLTIESKYINDNILNSVEEEFNRAIGHNNDKNSNVAINMFDYVETINGDVNLSNNLGKVATINGNVFVNDNFKADNLKIINGNLLIRNEHNITTLPHLEKINGDLSIVNERAFAELPELKSIKGSFKSCDCGSIFAPNLERIESDYMSSYFGLYERYGGGNHHFTDEFPKFSYIGGDVRLDKSGLKANNNLKVGGYVISSDEYKHRGEMSPQPGMCGTVWINSKNAVYPRTDIDRKVRLGVIGKENMPF